MKSVLDAVNISNEYIYSGSENQTRVASEWNTDKLQVLISTTIGLVGNESTKTQLVCITGLLYNIPSIVQSIGRIRPKQRNDDSLVRVFVPHTVNARLHLDKVNSEHNFQQLCSTRIIAETNRSKYRKCMTVTSVYEWVNCDLGCRFVSLAARMGYNQDICKVCDNCRKSPANKSAILKRKEVKKYKEEKDFGLRLLHKCKSHCPCCKNTTCIGTCVVRKQKGIYCFHCLGSHVASKCPGKWKKVLEGKACYSCFRYRLSDNDNHHFSQCSKLGEIQERLRGLIHYKYFDEVGKGLEQNFIQYLAGIYANESTYFKFLYQFKNIT